MAPIRIQAEYMVKNKKQLIPIIAVIAVGILLGSLILTWDKTSPDASADASSGSSSAEVNPEGPSDDINTYRTGPKGGKLFTTDGFSVEVTIFEDGVPPRFRLYLYENGKPLPPSAAKVAITLSRLGQPAKIYTLKPRLII